MGDSIYKILVGILFLTLLVSLIYADCYSGDGANGGDYIPCQESSSGLGEYYIKRTNCDCNGDELVYTDCSSDRNSYPSPSYNVLGTQTIRKECDACHGYGCSHCDSSNCSSCYESTYPSTPVKYYQCIYSPGSETCRRSKTTRSSDNSTTIQYGQACTPYRCDFKNGEGYYTRGGIRCDSDLHSYHDVETEDIIGICTTDAEKTGGVGCSSGIICKYENPGSESGTATMSGCSSECIQNASGCDKDIWYGGGSPPYNTTAKKTYPGFEYEGHCAPDGVCNHKPSVSSAIFIQRWFDDESRKLIVNISLDDSELQNGPDSLSAKIIIKSRNFTETEYTETFFSETIECDEEITTYCYIDSFSGEEICSDSKKARCVKEWDICSGEVELEKAYQLNVTPNDGHEDGSSTIKTLNLGSAFPTVNYINITPDYDELYKDNDNVNYDDLFNIDPMFYCEYEIDDNDCCDTNFKVYYTISGMSWPDEEMQDEYEIEGTTTCGKNTICKIPIPQENIRPDDNLQCEIYAEDQWKLGGISSSERRDVPNFDLLPGNVYAIQSIKGATLVKDKETMIRIEPYFDSQIIDTAIYVSGQASFVGSNTLYKLHKDHSKYRPVDKANGEGGINLFSFRPDQIGPLEITAEINSDLKFKEKSTDNNEATISVNVKPIKKQYKILFVPVKKATGADIDTINDGQIPGPKTKNIAETCNKQSEYFIGSYPFPKSGIDVVCENRVVLLAGIGTGAFHETYYYSPGDMYVIKNLEKQLLKQLGIDSNEYDWVVGVLINDGNKLVGAHGVHYPSLNGVILINQDVHEWVTAHEIGHCFGFLEQYETSLGPWKWNAIGYKIRGSIPLQYFSLEEGGDWDEITWPHGYIANGWFVSRGKNGARLYGEPEIHNSPNNHYGFMAGEDARFQPWILDNHYNYFMDSLITGGHDPILFSIHGEVHENGTGDIWPIFRFEGFYEPEAYGDYSIEVYNGAQLLSRTYFNVPVYSNFTYNSTFFGVTALYDSSMTHIKLKHNYQMLDEIVKTSNSPEIIIHSTSEVNGIVSVDWECNDADGDKIYYKASLQCDNTVYNPISEFDEIITEFNVTDMFGGDNCNIKLEATDGISIDIEITSSFSLNNNVPVSIINNPEENSVFYTSDYVTFIGTGWDMEEGEISNIDWYLDTVLQAENSPFSITNLSEGLHTIRLDTTDEKGASSYVERNFIVNNSIEPTAVVLETRVDPHEILAEDLEPYGKFPVTVESDVFLTKHNSICKINFYEESKFDTQYVALHANQVESILTGFWATKEGIVNISADIECYFKNIEVTLDKGWNLVSFTLNPFRLETDMNLSLEKGWNMIGYSGYQSFYWLDTRVSDGSTTKTISQAEIAGWIQSTIYHYEPKNRYYTFIPDEDEYIDSNKAYWLYSKTNDLTLTFPGKGGSSKSVAIFWENATVEYQDEEKSLEQAQSAGWLQGTIYLYDAQDGYYTFIPEDYENVKSWEGYWIYSKQENVTIKLPYYYKRYN